MTGLGRFVINLKRLRRCQRRRATLDLIRSDRQLGAIIQMAELQMLNPQMMKYICFIETSIILHSCTTARFFSQNINCVQRSQVNLYSKLVKKLLDHLFDLGLMTFSENGAVVFSLKLSQDDIKKLGLSGDLKLSKLPAELMGYMKYHREKVFKND
ncbi:hypothetical protein BIY28_06360 [Brenneria goodwinii]|nr:hypothetical protein BIY28_06360 [Brenneria goodwinii]